MCLITVGDKLCRMLALQEQDWLALVYTIVYTRFISDCQCISDDFSMTVCSYSRWRQVTNFINESTNLSFISLFKHTDSFRNEISESLNSSLNRLANNRNKIPLFVAQCCDSDFTSF